MHPAILTPQSPCMASAVPVAIAMALRSIRMGAPAAGVCVAGVSYREAVGRKRGPAIAGVQAGSAGTQTAGSRPAPSCNLQILPSRGLPSPLPLTPEVSFTPAVSRVNT
jgi:hypothetical protein